MHDCVVFGWTLLDIAYICAWIWLANLFTLVAAALNSDAWFLPLNRVINMFLGRTPILILALHISRKFAKPGMSAECSEYWFVELWQPLVLKKWAHFHSWRIFTSSSRANAPCECYGHTILERHLLQIFFSTFWLLHSLWSLKNRTWRQRQLYLCLSK